MSLYRYIAGTHSTRTKRKSTENATKKSLEDKEARQKKYKKQIPQERIYIYSNGSQNSSTEPDSGSDSDDSETNERVAEFTEDYSSDDETTEETLNIIHGYITGTLR